MILLGLAIFRKELQREFKKESPLPATSETKEPPKVRRSYNNDYIVLYAISGTTTTSSC
jgi:hypothetical protein